MKYSRQRSIILKEMESYRDHPSAMEIYDRVKKNLPNISLGTVYRNLNVLVEEGKIIRIHGDDCDRFDRVMTQHDHFKCIVCHKIYDIEHPLLITLNEQIKKDMGYVVQHHELMFTGICYSCNKRKKV